MERKAKGGQRLLACIIDIIIVGLLSSIIGSIAGVGITNSNAIMDCISPELTQEQMMECIENAGVIGKSSIQSGIFLAIFLLYFVGLPLIWSKQTAGRAIFKIKVVTQENQKIGFGTLIVRELIGSYLIGYVLLVCCCIPGIINLVMMFGKNQTTIHDNIAGTMMVSSTYIEDENEDSMEHDFDSVESDFKYVDVDAEDIKVVDQDK